MITLPGFSLPVDIANRALHHVGADHELVTINDQKKSARLFRALYNRIKAAELRHNSWTFAIRHAILRPLDTTSVVWTPPTYSAVATYAVGAVVQWDDGLGSRLFIATKAIIAGDTPASTNWDDFFGCLIVQPWDVTAKTVYYTGEVVYKGAYTMYLALGQASDDPALNVSGLWATVGTVAQPLKIMYPLSAGPLSQVGTNNAFPLPYGFRRKLKYDPNAGMVSVLGFPSNAMVTDEIIENNLLLSRDGTPRLLRFVADVANVATMEPLFCEALAAKIGAEMAEPITQSSEKVKVVTAEYNSAITEARMQNAIEDGADAPELDDWIACRM